jgi:formyltetrahydrofolate deformylase
VFSNHETLKDISQWYGVPFHYLPVDSDNRVAQEQEILNLFKSSGAELLVLARYMLILSDAFFTEVRG